MIPAKTNLVLLCILSVITLFELVAMPVILQGRELLMSIVALALIPLSTPFWSLIHEAIHRNLHPDNAANESMGRILSILFGASFHVLRFAHLMHHQYNRHWESEYYDEKQSKWLAWINHYFKMLGGLYITEVLTTFAVALLPCSVTRIVSAHVFKNEKHHQAALNMLLKPGSLHKIRMDCVLIAALYACCFYLYAGYGSVILIILMGRAVLVSLMDNAYHYGTPLDNSIPAKELELHPFLAMFILNFNYHLTHHQNAGLPWSQLARHHDERENSYSQKLITAIIDQFRGPLKI